MVCSLSSSTGANSGLTTTNPIVVTDVPEEFLSGAASKDSTHQLSQQVSSPTTQASARGVPVGRS